VALHELVSKLDEPASRSTALLRHTGAACPDSPTTARASSASDVAGTAGDRSTFDVYREGGSRPRRGSRRSAKALYFEAKTFLHGLLVVEEKVSKAHGLEVRVAVPSTNALVAWPSGSPRA
jgi:hypothetical protein